MNLKKSILYSIVFLIVIAFIGSCKKDDSIDSDTVSASDCVNAENFFSNAKSIMDEAGLKNGPYNGILIDSSIVVQFDSSNSTDSDTITVNFGNTYKTCIDGRMRKGKISCIYLGNYNDTSNSHSISFSNYYIDFNMINGKIKDAFSGFSPSGHKYYHDTMTGSLRYSNGTTVTWYARNVISFIAGDSSVAWNDDVMTINGTAAGTTSDNQQFSMNINSSLIKNFIPNCSKYIVKGGLQIAIRDKNGRTADLGDGSCDDLISVSIDGNIYQAHAN